ncbi:hypothetical protein OIO90_004527 [Microbotryomycetes sp. JL221]|nr:hypothetical protein OIO90_004527 [Microbotryomycetes sp. JL221]
MFEYVQLKAIVTLMRTITSVTRKWPNPMPDEVLHITARDKHKIKVHVYEPTASNSNDDSNSDKRTIVINMHGSGFVLTCHGESDTYCRTLRDQARVTVYDVAYRLAPEWPFPSAYNDAEDVLQHVLNQYPNSSIVMSGFSAGAGLALCVSSNASQHLRNKVKACITFYPPDVGTPLEQRIAPEVDPLKPESAGIPRSIMRIFDRCYIGLSKEVERNQDGSLIKDPRFSITTNQQQLEAMPDTVVVFTGGMDSLAPEAEAFIEKLRTARTRAVVNGNAEGARERTIIMKRFETRHHAWDINLSREGDTEARDEAYSKVVEVIKHLA